MSLFASVFRSEGRFSEAIHTFLVVLIVSKKRQLEMTAWTQCNCAWVSLCRSFLIPTGLDLTFIILVLDLNRSSISHSALWLDSGLVTAISLVIHRPVTIYYLYKSFEDPTAPGKFPKPATELQTLQQALCITYCLLQESLKNAFDDNDMTYQPLSVMYNETVALGDFHALALAFSQRTL